MYLIFKQIKSTLPLLELRIFLIDDVKFSFPSDNLALCRTLLDGRFDFHGSMFIYLYL